MGARVAGLRGGLESHQKVIGVEGKINSIYKKNQIHVTEPDLNLFLVMLKSGAGYGNRTRLPGLGSPYTTDVLIPHY